MNDPPNKINKTCENNTILSRKNCHANKMLNGFELLPRTKKLRQISGCDYIESCAVLHDVFEYLVDAYILIDLKGNVIRMNQSAVKLFGFQCDDAINLLDVIVKDDYDFALKSFDSLLQKGKLIDFEVRIITKNNDIKLVHVNSNIVYDEAQKPIALQGIVRDITKESKAALLFKEQKRQLSVIIENSPLGIVLTRSGVILKTNTTFADFLGYSEGELIGRSVKELSFDEDRDNSLSLIKRMAAGEIDQFTIIKRYIKKDESLLIAKTTVNVVKDNNQKVLHQVAMIEDITNEVHESSMLSAINSLMASIIGKMDIHEIAWEIAKKTIKLFGFEDCVVYVLDDTGTELEQIAAYGPKNPKKKQIYNKISIKVGEGIVGAVAKTGVSEIIPDTTKEARYIEDDQFRLSEIAVPIIADGKIIGVIDSEHSTKNYFTPTHLETLKNISNLAASQIKSAVSIKQKKQVEKQRNKLLKKLETSNLELQEYAHVVSHDLKSPLRNISTLVAWIREDYEHVFDDAGLENLELIDSTLGKMENLISDVLCYSSTSNNLPVEPVDINQILNETIKSIHVPDNVSINIMNRFPVIYGHAIRFKQVFQNLIENAIFYNDKEQCIIELDVIEKEEEFIFLIKDNGMGIDAKFFDKIFEVFQSLTPVATSTGIGLSLVKKIVQQYGGTVSLESKLTIGTTFYVQLPKITNVSKE